MRGHPHIQVLVDIYIYIYVHNYVEPGRDTYLVRWVVDIIDWLYVDL